MEKINMTIGRFQPFTKGHLNMVNEGNAKCIIYQIKPQGVPESLKGWKVNGKIVKKSELENILKYVNTNGSSELNEHEKEIMKRPFTNELIAQELDIVKMNNKNILDVVYVKNMYDALMRFNKFCTDNIDKYEPQYWMCGDDRVDNYEREISHYDELDTELGSGIKIPNILKGKLKTNTGTGRTEGVSGTAVRNSIITNNKAEFTRIMPNGVDKMFNVFKSAFDEFINKLNKMIKERLSLKEFILMESK